MSVDKTIQDLGNTVTQLGNLVNNINGQIAGISDRINVTLRNLDGSISGVADEVKTVTLQVGNVLDSIPETWLWYLLFITLIIVFILLSILIIMSLVTKIYQVVQIFKGQDPYAPNRRLLADSPDSALSTPLSPEKRPAHMSLPMHNDKTLVNRKTPQPSFTNPGIFEVSRRTSSSGLYNVNNNNVENGSSKIGSSQEIQPPRRPYLRKGEEQHRPYSHQITPSSSYHNTSHIPVSPTSLTHGNNNFVNTSQLPISTSKAEAV